MASAGIDYVELGKMAGKLAAQILKGEAKACLLYTSDAADEL